MDFTDFSKLLSGYTTEKILTAVAVIIISLLLKQTLLKNKHKKIIAAIPFTAGIILSLLIAFLKDEECNFACVLNDGISIGSAATVIYTFISTFINSDCENVPVDSLIIEGILAGYLDGEELYAVSEICAQIVRQSDDAVNTAEMLKCELAKYITNIDESEVYLIAKTIANVLSAIE